MGLTLDWVYLEPGRKKVTRLATDPAAFGVKLLDFMVKNAY